ncbi:MAG TPA: hypothetical protein VHR66_15330 [Gemmataceae bacterium]|jgi:hypothetical protein|nr:hypothetical protein [Gemmataceae bacterium]
MLSRRSFLVSSLGAVATPSMLLAQRTGFNEREVIPQLTANDKEDIWTLHVRFQDPRIIVEKVPARGTKICWYMVYRVYNLDPRQEPVTFVPDIELVTLDRHTRHPDEILPSVEEAIRKIEDPTGRFHMKNSVTITADQIPVSSKDAYPKAVTGVAIWTGVDDPIPGSKEPVPKTNKFSIFIAGLSNGYTEERPIDRPGVKIIKRKTLQLDFERLGAGDPADPSGIRWTGNATWMYRASTDPLKAAEPAAPATPPADPKKEDEKKDKVFAPRLEPIPTSPVKRVRD